MSILVLAGDLTNYYLYRQLQESNHRVQLEGFSHLEEKRLPKPIKLAGFKTIIAPIPLTIDGSTLYSPYSEESIYLDQFFSRADSDCRIIGGPFSQKDERIFDLTKSRFFTDQTVLPTCEELIKIIIEKSDSTILGSNITIAGTGRVTTKLTAMLELLGANVLGSDKENINKADIIIITHTTHNLKDKELAELSDRLVIDITHKKLSKSSGKHIIKARGLPGKSAPKSVADYIYKTLIKERLIP